MKYKILIVLIWVLSNLSAQTQAELSLRKTVASFNADTTLLLAKNDTTKMLNGVRNSMTSFSPAEFKQVIADSCYSTFVDYISVSNGSIGNTTIVFDKTIENPKVFATPIFTTQLASGTGNFSWYVHNVMETECQISIHNNNVSGLISIGFNLRVCPDGF